MIYHFNPETGATGLCSARKKCPFGGDENHFTDEGAARLAYERTQSTKLPATSKKSSSASPAQPDLTPYSSLIESLEVTEAYAHPQGKIALVDRYNGLKVFKNGKAATTSGTLEQLREGRGSWRPIAIPGSGHYAQTTTAAATPSVSAGRVRSVQEQLADTEVARKQRLKVAGYPEKSTLDPAKASEIEFYSVTHNDYHNPAAILPVGENFNPHTSMSNSEYIPVWATGTGTSIEIWRSSAGSYRAVATSGNKVDGLSSTTHFAHDQTRRRMGDLWTMVGAFIGKDGGGVVGDVPNRKLPLSTYK